MSIARIQEFSTGVGVINITEFIMNNEVNNSYIRSTTFSD